MPVVFLAVTSLTPGANAALSTLQLTVTLQLGEASEPAALLLADHGKVRSADDFVAAHNPVAPGVTWGAQCDGGWQLGVDLASVPSDVATIRFVGSLPEGGGTFGQRAFPSARVQDTSGATVASFEMAGLSSETSLIALELYRRQDAWKVRAVGQGYTGGRRELLAGHGIDPGAVPATPSPAASPAQQTQAAVDQLGLRYERADRGVSTPAHTPTPSPAAASPGQPRVRYERADRASRVAVGEPAHPSTPPRSAQQPPSAEPSLQVPAAVTGPFALWDLVEQPKSGMQPVRPVRWETQGAEFTWCERVSNTLPDSASLPPESDKFTVSEQWALQLRPVRGAGFEYTWRDPQDRRLDPTWVTLRSALVDHDTGRIVGAGHLTHENFGVSPAYDLGALTGSNGMSWAEKGHTEGLQQYPTVCLYVGSTRTGVLAPVDSSSNLVSVDLDRFTGTIAVLEVVGMIGCISVYDGAMGTRRRLAVIDQVSGNEQLRFSLDGKWLLLPRYDGAYLCEVSTGRLMRLPVNECCWWPLADSTLLEIAKVDEKRVPRLFNLETNTCVHEFSPISFGTERTSDIEYVAHPAVSPDGTELLASTPVGVGQEYRDEHGVAGHLARITLADGRGRLVHPALLNTPFLAERDVSESRWTTAYPYRRVTLAPALSSQLQAPTREHSSLAAGTYSPEAEELLVRTLNRAIALFQQDQDVAHLMPEIVMSLTTAHEDPEVWRRQQEWVVGLTQTVTDMITAGTLTGRNADAWMNFAAVVMSLVTTGAPGITATAAAWV